jgi:hypothetical protein
LLKVVGKVDALLFWAAAGDLFSGSAECFLRSTKLSKSERAARFSRFFVPDEEQS